MAKCRGNNQRFQYCADPSGQEFLYFRALQGHSGGNLIDLSSQDNVLIPNYFFEYIHHIECAINLQFTTNSGLMPGGQNLSIGRRCSSRLWLLWTKNTEIRTKLTWKCRVLRGTIRRSGRNIKTLCIGSICSLLKRKDLSSIKHDGMQSSFTAHSQLIVSRRLSWWKLENHMRESICVTLTSSKDFLQRQLDGRIGFRSCWRWKRLPTNPTKDQKYNC